MKRMIRIGIGLVACVAVALSGGCDRGKKQAAPAAGGGAKKSEYVFGVVAKSQSNPVFQAARVGAEDAAADLSKKLGVKIKIEWQTPNEEDAQKQAEFLEQLVLKGVDGISVSCSNADTLTPAINDAVKKGVAVMCFDSDAPASKRFCYHGTEDGAAGKAVMREMIKILGPGKHTVAILSGNQNAPNLQKRVKGAQQVAKDYPDITIRSVYYGKETPQDLAARVEEVQTVNPDIEGWISMGGWPLMTDALMKWEPGKIKIVSMDALPAQLPYVRKGIAQKLFAQNTYQWGYRSVELLAEKLINGKDPATVLDFATLTEVSKENVDAWEGNWKKWLR